MVAHTLPVIRGADAIALIDGGAVAELGTTRNCSRAAAGTRACGAPRGPGGGEDTSDGDGGATRAGPRRPVAPLDSNPLPVVTDSTDPPRTGPTPRGAESPSAAPFRPLEEL